MTKGEERWNQWCPHVQVIWNLYGDPFLNIICSSLIIVACSVFSSFCSTSAGTAIASLVSFAVHLPVPFAAKGLGLCIASSAKSMGFHVRADQRRRPPLCHQMSCNICSDRCHGDVADEVSPGIL